jgi:RNA polymerase sigma-70 factor (ECF subfamily)
MADLPAARTARESTNVVAASADPRAAAAKAVLVDLEQREGQALFGFAVRLGLSDAEAQDAVQESFLRLWAQWSADTSITNPRNWTFRTIYRIAMDEHRLRRRALGILDRIGQASGWATTPEPREQLDVWSAVDRLTDRQRQVVYLRYQADLAFEEIGTVLGISASAARSHATFALAALRKTFIDSEVPR